MADKLDMKSMNIAEDNVKKLGALFPNVVTEVMDENGSFKFAVDFDALKQELSNNLINEKQERYQMTWPDKSQAKVLANSRITATLRPDVEKSVNFDTTKNLYIEGDNLDVLKLLRETYLNKIKLIYIDPPYNTGKDSFVYDDDFAISADDYSKISGEYDEIGNRIVKNLDSNGRFHTDWLNMMYPRLKIARDLLTDDGMIFISIDDNEFDNLKKMCDEIFGASNYVAMFVWKSKSGGANDSNLVAVDHEYILMYAKNIEKASTNLIAYTEELETLYTGKDEHFEERGPYRPMLLQQKGLSFSKSLTYEIEAPDGSILVPESGGAIWRWSKEKFIEAKKNGFVEFRKVGDMYKVYTKQYLYVDYDGNKIERGKLIRTVIDDIDGRLGTKYLQTIFENKVFTNSKPVELIKQFIYVATNKNDYVLDFFSGSATTAHAVMQLNAEDNGNRKFILIQIPENCDVKSEAYKAGYKTICEIGEERIRRTGKKLAKENDIDVGFRVLKLDSSNMNDVYYNPTAFNQSMLDMTVDNVKADRTPLDLLFQVMLDLGVELSADIVEKTVNGKKIYAVNVNDLIACFDNDIDNDVITAIAKENPLYAVFKDNSFATDSAGINNEQLFKTYSPSTVVKVI